MPSRAAALALIRKKTLAIPAAMNQAREKDAIIKIPLAAPARNKATLDEGETGQHFRIILIASQLTPRETDESVWE
jgi:hypothetical protein